MPFVFGAAEIVWLCDNMFCPYDNWFNFTRTTNNNRLTMNDTKRCRMPCRHVQIKIMFILPIIDRRKAHRNNCIRNTRSERTAAAMLLVTRASCTEQKRILSGEKDYFSSMRTIFFSAGFISSFSMNSVFVVSAFVFCFYFYFTFKLSRMHPHQVNNSHRFLTVLIVVSSLVSSC